MKQFFAVVLLIMVCLVSAEDAASRHGGEDHGVVGTNGIKQHASFRISKVKQNTDAAVLLLDLGDHKYTSNKPDQLVNPTPPEGTSYRPTILVTIGSLPTMTGVANAKGVIEGELFTAKLFANGAGMKIQIKKGNLSALLSTLSAQPEGHAFLTITVNDNHAETAALTAAPRHEHSLYTAQFELDVKENDKSLTAKD